jgi:hypothetical protein
MPSREIETNETDIIEFLISGPTLHRDTWVKLLDARRNFLRPCLWSLTKESVEEGVWGLYQKDSSGKTFHPLKDDRPTAIGDSLPLTTRGIFVNSKKTTRFFGNDLRSGRKQWIFHVAGLSEDGQWLLIMVRHEERRGQGWRRQVATEVNIRAVGAE